jgi:hypothetical protein
MAYRIIARFANAQRFRLSLASGFTGAPARLRRQRRLRRILEFSPEL